VFYPAFFIDDFTQPVTHSAHIVSNLYHPLILELNARPHHFEKRPDATFVLEAFNPLCGDRYRIYLDVRDEQVESATFHGYGCAVSKAAVSVLMTKIDQKSLKEVSEIVRHFFLETGLKAVIPTESATPLLSPDEQMAFAAVIDYPARLACVTLAWEVMEKFCAK
jgi:nitrogen fixation protein NifU and related proteins